MLPLPIINASIAFPSERIIVSEGCDKLAFRDYVVEEAAQLVRLDTVNLEELAAMVCHDVLKSAVSVSGFQEDFVSILQTGSEDDLVLGELNAIMRLAQKNDWNPKDQEYWKSQGWLDKQRPWKD